MNHLASRSSDFSRKLEHLAAEVRISLIKQHIHKVWMDNLYYNFFLKHSTADRRMLYMLCPSKRPRYPPTSAMKLVVS